MNLETSGRETLLEKIFSLTPANFAAVALETWAYQRKYNNLYARYCDLVLKDAIPASLEEIPFLPISFFKTHAIICGTETPDNWFESSGTSAKAKSRHFISDISIYRKSFLQEFIHQYGDLENICIIGLLPSYLEHGKSSLVFMVKELIEKSGVSGSGFYLYEHEKLASQLQENESTGIKTILIGVTYALLDFFEAHPTTLQHTTVMETGGMKGRKKELLRKEVHEILKQKTNLESIQSEYGMTELFSQAYAKKDGIFTPAATMKIMIRPQDDPLVTEINSYKSLTGLINIIDLANIDSCSFIATEDAGTVYENGSFEVTGRFDNADARGCSLMLT